MQVIEPLKGEKKLKAYLDEDAALKNVLIFFWHGLGDLIMFLNLLESLKNLYPDREFTLALPKGLGQEEIVPDAILVEADETKDFSGDRFKEFDLIARINMPMNEGQQEYTKGEWCCIHELGISPVAGHWRLPYHRNRLVGVHFQITCLPESCNPDKETAEKVWNDILEAGYIPLEVHFEHVFHNPVNTKFDFIDATVRRVKPRISTLVGLIQNCGAFVGIVSGPFHVALATLPHNRIMLLEKDFKRGSFTKLPIATSDLRNYNGEVKKWLEGIEK